MTRRHFFSLCAVSAALCLSSTTAFGQAVGAHGDDFLYRVMAGDTLGDLATRYTSGWSTWTTLQSLNHVQDQARLPIGQVLKIPFSLIPELPSTADVSYMAGQAALDGRPLRLSSSVAEGQAVSTQADGFVTLKLADGSVLSLPASSTMVVKRLRVFKGTGLIDIKVEVGQGTLESHVAPKHEGVGRFEVRTPVSVTGVRGTRFRVHFSSSQGARSEVVQGVAGVEAPHGADVMLKAKQGMAVDASGASLGVRELLPAPLLSKPADGGGSMTIAPVEGASGYLVRVAEDPDGTKMVSSKLFSSNRIDYAAPGPGTYYLLVRAVDNIGLGGLDARQAFAGKPVLQGYGGAPVLSGYGLPILVSDY